MSSVDTNRTPVPVEVTDTCTSSQFNGVMCSIPLGHFEVIKSGPKHRKSYKKTSKIVFQPANTETAKRKVHHTHGTLAPA